MSLAVGRLGVSIGHFSIMWPAVQPTALQRVEEPAGSEREGLGLEAT